MLVLSQTLVQKNKAMTKRLVAKQIRTASKSTQSDIEVEAITTSISHQLFCNKTPTFPLKRTKSQILKVEESEFVMQMIQTQMAQ
ncbi:hypothetical protein GQ457_06G039660 [Hibiscus cannabinus]